MEIKRIELKGDIRNWKQAVNGLIRSFTQKVISDEYTQEGIPSKFCFKRQDPTGEGNVISLLSFPIEAKGKNLVDSDLVISETRNSGFLPLDLRRFLMIKDQFPEILKKHSVITFGSVWKKGLDVFVPCLWKDSGSVPDLLTALDLWGPPCYFAVAS